MTDRTKELEDEVQWQRIISIIFILGGTIGFLIAIIIVMNQPAMYIKELGYNQQTYKLILIIILIASSLSAVTIGIKGMIDVYDSEEKKKISPRKSPRRRN
jgi:hypothetical protein